MENFNGNPEYNQNYNSANNQNYNTVNNQNVNPQENSDANAGGKKKFWTSNIIGFLLILVFGPLSAVTGFPLFFVGVFVGVVMFATFSTATIDTGFVIANTNTVLVRKRRQLLFIPFVIVSFVCTLGKGILSIPYKEEYFLGKINDDKNADFQPIPRSEYKRILAEQRQIYSKYVLDPQFVKNAYTLESLGLQKKKIRLILASVFAGLSLFCVIVPGGFAVALIYCIVFVPMIILWIPDYKDAKIMHDAYIRSVGNPDYPNNPNVQQ